MAHLVPNSFSTFQLDEDEVLQGSMFTISQLQVLQNNLASYAEERLAQEYNPASPMQFIQQEAFNKGAMAALSFLIENSNALQNLED